MRMGGRMRFRICFGILLWGGAAIGQDLMVEHSECALFGPKYEQFMARAADRGGPSRHQKQVSALTSLVASILPPAPGGSRTGDFYDQVPAGTIDHYIFTAMQSAGVAPAPPTNDYEFI